MDDKIRQLERQARNGDPDAAHKWYVEKMRTAKDIGDQYQTLMAYFELSNPGLMEQLNQINEMVQQVKIQEVEIADPPWTTEIVISDHSSGGTLEVQPYNGLTISSHTGL